MVQTVFRRQESVTTTVYREQLFRGLDVAYGFDLKCCVELKISVALGFFSVQKCHVLFSLLYSGNFSYFSPGLYVRSFIKRQTQNGAPTTQTSNHVFFAS